MAMIVRLACELGTRGSPSNLSSTPPPPLRQLCRICGFTGLPGGVHAFPGVGPLSFLPHTRSFSVTLGPSRVFSAFRAHAWEGLVLYSRYSTRFRRSRGVQRWEIYHARLGRPYQKSLRRSGGERDDDHRDGEQCERRQVGGLCRQLHDAGGGHSGQALWQGCFNLATLQDHPRRMSEVHLVLQGLHDQFDQ